MKHFFELALMQLHNSIQKTLTAEIINAKLRFRNFISF